LIRGKTALNILISPSTKTTTKEEAEAGANKGQGEKAVSKRKEKVIGQRKK